MQALRTHSFYTQALVNCLQRLLRNIRPALIVRLRGRRDRRWQHRPGAGKAELDVAPRIFRRGPVSQARQGLLTRALRAQASDLRLKGSPPKSVLSTPAPFISRRPMAKRKGASDCSKKPCRSPLIASAKVKPACKMVARSARVRKAQQRAVTRKLSAAPEPSTQVKPTAGNDWRESAQPCRSPWISSAKVKPACKSAERSPAGRKLQKRAVKWNLFRSPRAQHTREAQVTDVRRSRRARKDRSFRLLRIHAAAPTGAGLPTTRASREPLHKRRVVEWRPQVSGVSHSDSQHSDEPSTATTAGSTDAR